MVYVLLHVQNGVVEEAEFNNDEKELLRKKKNLEKDGSESKLLELDNISKGEFIEVWCKGGWIRQVTVKDKKEDPNEEGIYYFKF